MRILYAGDSPLGGPANYLWGVLKFLKADFLHLPPSKALSPRLLKKKFDAILLSDFSKVRVPPASEELMVEQVERGAGLLMIGGWGSFAAGGWRRSAVERMLPVTCLNRDDRVNFPGGAFLSLKKKHPMFQSIPFNHPPVICGLNRFRPKRNACVILTARKIVCGSGFQTRPHREISLDRYEYPLLVIDSDPQKRIAALATDLAPHWSGGLVDWGSRRVKIRVQGKISIELGSLYVRFVSSLLIWLGQAKGIDNLLR